MGLDRTGNRAQWDDARRAELQYNVRLRSVARQVGHIVKGFAPDGVIHRLDKLLANLEGYANLIEPWAQSVAAYMLADVGRRNERLWKSRGRAIANSLRSEVATSAHGAVYKQMMDEQVTLIQSIPRKAAERVHLLTNEARYSGRRAEDIAQEIKLTGRVSESRARLIARTEVSRTAATFMQARAMSAGSEGYIWRTSRDSDVRPSHQAMEGRYVRWDTPPKTDKSLDPYHAGCGPNCRCYPEPVLPDF